MYEGNVFVKNLHFSAFVRLLRGAFKPVYTNQGQHSRFYVLVLKFCWKIKFFKFQDRVQYVGKTWHEKEENLYLRPLYVLILFTAGERGM